jgi:hypothetical protein
LGAENSGEIRDRGATRALVLGLFSLWFGIVAPFAIFSSVRSLRRIHSSDGALRGAGSATAGLVAGLVAVIVIAAGVAYWIFAS